MSSNRIAYAFFMLWAAGVFILARRLLPPPPGAVRLVPRQQFWLGLAAFIGGALGAKIPFVVHGGIMSLDAWLADGKTITTALIGGYLAVEFAKLILGIHGSTGDAWAI